KRQPPASMTAGKKIAGFTTEVVRTEFTGMSKDIIDIFGSSVLYASTDLHYTIPPLYSRNPQLLMVNGGKIVLGGDFFLPDYPYADTGNGKDTTRENQLLFTVRADQVIPQKLEASLFSVPDGFEKWSYNYEYDSTMVDSTAMYLDSAAAAPQKPTTKKNKKTPSKKKATTKQSATRRKGD
ncbi:MAG TPA: hypothetical protein VER36_00895, partial [Flavisolibacter sp.]|nr:hypothetical protein [Flavisolibacter sp.]